MKSEIRDSEIFGKVSKRNYGKYLMIIKVKKLRGFEEKQINFDFPVTALIGPNGGGKTTILGATGILHIDIKPKRFFAKNGVFDNSMSDWKIEYSIIDKNEDNRNFISKTVSYGGYKWSRNAITRSIAVLALQELFHRVKK
jgi:recombinational DNA repair ATPase RecF